VLSLDRTADLLGGLGGRRRLRSARDLRPAGHRRPARPDAGSTGPLIPRCASAPAARTSSLPSVGRLFAPRPGS